MLLPYNVYSSHWVLVVVDLKIKNIYFLNPGGVMPSEEETVKNLSHFFLLRDEINMEKLNARNWTVQQLPHFPMQRDSHNCGVYIINYINTLSINPDINQCFVKDECDSFNPEAFRITVQNILLTCSDDVFDLCLLCGLNISDPYVKCNICQRLLHSSNNCAHVNKDKDEFLEQLVKKPIHTFVLYVEIKEILLKAQKTISKLV